MKIIRLKTREKAMKVAAIYMLRGRFCKVVKVDYDNWEVRVAAKGQQ